MSILNHAITAFKNRVHKILHRAGIRISIVLSDIFGKSGTIILNGVLFGTSNEHKKLRQLLLEKCQLEAVISMQSGVFKPYAGVSTAVLVFIKGDKTL